MRWLLLDVALVGLFAVLGRLSHYGALTLTGWAETGVPFLIGAVLAHVALRRAGLAPATLAAGGIVWITTLGCGMALRVATGQGTALPFVLVATGTLLLLLVGARVLVVLAARLHDRNQAVESAR